MSTWPLLQDIAAAVHALPALNSKPLPPFLGQQPDFPHVPTVEMECDSACLIMGDSGMQPPHLLYGCLQVAKDDLQSFGFVVVEMVRDACQDTMSLLEVSMNETLGRTSKLVSALSRSMGPRRGDSELPYLLIFLTVKHGPAWRTLSRPLLQYFDWEASPS